MPQMNVRVTIIALFFTTLAIGTVMVANKPVRVADPTLDIYD